MLKLQTQAQVQLNKAGLLIWMDVTTAPKPLPLRKRHTSHDGSSLTLCPPEACIQQMVSFGTFIF